MNLVSWYEFGVVIYNFIFSFIIDCAESRSVEQLPKFTQIQCPSTKKNIDMCIKVEFPKDTTEDLLLLKQTHPGITLILSGVLESEGHKVTVILADKEISSMQVSNKYLGAYKRYQDRICGKS